jgi:hypothetical protein
LVAVSLLPLSAWGQATTSSLNETVPFSDHRISCTGELVDIEGDQHFVAHSTVDAAGGAHLVSHDNLQGAGGESSSAVRYREVGAALDDGYTTHFGQGGAYEETESERTLHLISQGAEDNAHNHVVRHVTYNANGEPTADVADADIRCTG